MRRVRASAAVVFPDPLSPTTATVSPGATEKERSWTATTVFEPDENRTERFLTSSKGEDMGIRGIRILKLGDALGLHSVVVVALQKSESSEFSFSRKTETWVDGVTQGIAEEVKGNHS